MKSGLILLLISIFSLNAPATEFSVISEIKNKGKKNYGANSFIINRTLDVYSSLRVGGIKYKNIVAIKEKKIRLDANKSKLSASLTFQLTEKFKKTYKVTGNYEDIKLFSRKYVVANKPDISGNDQHEYRVFGISNPESYVDLKKCILIASTFDYFNIPDNFYFFKHRSDPMIYGTIYSVERGKVKQQLDIRFKTKSDAFEHIHWARCLKPVKSSRVLNIEENRLSNGLIIKAALLSDKKQTFEFSIWLDLEDRLKFEPQIKVINGWINGKEDKVINMYISKENFKK